MKFDEWWKFLDKINTMNSHVTVTYSARGIRKKSGIIQETSSKGIKVDTKYISYRKVIDVRETNEE